MNGVLNVGYTTNFRHPKWSPIDKGAYNQYVDAYNSSGHPAPSLHKELSEQIVAVLYTVRNNTFHGGKRNDDANNLEVLRNDLPLLRMIVDSFIQPPEPVEDEYYTNGA